MSVWSSETKEGLLQYPCLFHLKVRSAASCPLGLTFEPANRCWALVPPLMQLLARFLCVLAGKAARAVPQDQRPHIAHYLFSVRVCLRVCVCACRQSCKSCIVRSKTSPLGCLGCIQVRLIIHTYTRTHVHTHKHTHTHTHTYTYTHTHIQKYTRTHTDTVFTQFAC